jgi:ectoine hydroxylase-related dioxygenase (phytanoyl-CoA dioxygenase family)
MLLMESDLELYEEQGYLVIDDFFSQTELSDFRESVRLIVRSFVNRAKIRFPDQMPDIADGEEFDKGTQILNDLDHDYVAQIYDTIAFSPAFMRIAGKPETTTIVNQLLGREAQAPLFGFKNRCRIDPPRDDRRTAGWHQQVFYGLPYAAEFIQTWAPLIHDTVQKNGTLEIAPGSHHSGIPKQHWIEEEDRVVQIIVDDEIVNQYPQNVMAMSVGQLLVFSGRTVHRSGKNTSTQTRYSLVGEYYDVDDPNFRAPRPTRSFRNATMKGFFDDFAARW